MAGKHSVLMSPNVMLGDEIGSGVQGGRRPGGGGRAGPRLANSGGINYPYTSVELMEAWESAFPAPSFIRDNLFGNIQTSSTKAVAVDYWKESQKLAPWVSPISMGRVVVRDKYKTAMWEPPKLAPIRTMHPEDLFDKAFGEAIGGYDDQGREALYVSQDMMTLDHLIARTEEKMCCEAVTSGSVTCYTIEGAEKLPIAQLDYEIQPQVVVAPDWSDPTTSDPLGDLKVAMRALSAVAGSQCDFVALGAAASDSFEKSQAVIDGYNKYWIRPGTLEPKEIEWGITVLGSHRGINLYSYGAMYEDDMTGAMTPYIPDNLVILAARAGGMGAMGYAGIWQEADDSKRHQLYEGSRVWRMYFESEVRYLRCTSKPVPIPMPSQNILILKVLP